MDTGVTEDYDEGSSDLASPFWDPFFEIKLCERFEVHPGHLLYRFRFNPQGDLFFDTHETGWLEFPAELSLPDGMDELYLLKITSPFIWDFSGPMCPNDGSADTGYALPSRWDTAGEELDSGPLDTDDSGEALDTAEQVLTENPPADSEPTDAPDQNNADTNAPSDTAEN